MTVYNDPRRTKAGWTNMGRILIPVLPQPIVLTDRADGTQWVISWNANNGPDSIGRISVTNDLTITAASGAHYFKSFEEPVIISDNVFVYRLFLRNQHLGLETLSLLQGEEAYRSPPVYARQINSIDRRQVRSSVSDYTRLVFTIDEDKE